MLLCHITLGFSLIKVFLSQSQCRLTLVQFQTARSDARTGATPSVFVDTLLEMKFASRMIGRKGRPPSCFLCIKDGRVQKLVEFPYSSQSYFISFGHFIGSEIALQRGEAHFITKSAAACSSRRDRMHYQRAQLATFFSNNIMIGSRRAPGRSPLNFCKSVAASDVEISIPGY